MTGSRLHGLWLKGRVTVYIGVVVAILLTRVGGLSWKKLRLPSTGAAGAAHALLISGDDLAPGLIHDLVARYRHDYPDLRIELRPGGTTQGLEDLANRRADAAFLSRPPTAEEQGLIVAAEHDTLLWFPMALGSLMLLRATGSGNAPLTTRECRDLLTANAAHATRLYAPDPNSGVWDAFVARLGLPPGPGGVPPPGVTFLDDQAAVTAAVKADPGSLGLVSSLGFPAGFQADGVDTVAVRATETAPPATPSDDAVAYGEYPLYHYLYVACRPHDSIRGTMFVTQLTSDRGQRQVERAGYLPARHPMREIALTTHPLGQPNP